MSQTYSGGKLSGWTQMSTWDESKHPRDSGKFAPKEGARKSSEEGERREKGGDEKQGNRFDKSKSVPDDSTMISSEKVWEDRIKQYEGKRGKEGSRHVPADTPDYEVGSWKIEEANSYSSYGRNIEQLVEFDPEELFSGEKDMIERNEEGRGDDANRYAEWLREGKKPPPIEVLETDKGELIITDGNRRLAAAQKAGEKIKAWVSWTVDGDMKTPQGEPIKTGLTYELAQKRGLISEGAEMPKEKQ